MDEAEAEAHEAGVNNLVFVQCFQDSPEESLWVIQTYKRLLHELSIKYSTLPTFKVYTCAQNSSHSKFRGIVAGLDLTKHDKLKTMIRIFKRDLQVPKFVGVRMILEPAEHEFFEK